MLGLSHVTYIDVVLARFSMQNFKKGFVPYRVGSSLSANQRPKTLAEIERMREIFYASAVESLMYAIPCYVPDWMSALLWVWLTYTSQVMEKNTE